MRRFVALGLVAALAAAGGCATGAKYVEKRADSGVVAVPDDSDEWPNYNRRAALKLIEQHVGPDYEIVQQETVSTGRTGQSRLPDTNETLNPRNPGSPAYRNPSTHATALPEGRQFQIVYRRKGAPADGVVQTGATGTAPNVQPAGGLTSPFNRPASARPATGGADCNH